MVSLGFFLSNEWLNPIHVNMIRKVGVCPRIIKKSRKGTLSIETMGFVDKRGIYCEKMILVLEQ